MKHIDSSWMGQPERKCNRETSEIWRAAAPPVPEGAAAAPPATLDGCENNVRYKGQSGTQAIGVVAVHARCGRRICPKCGRRLGVRVRDRLIELAEGQFRWPGLLTLTVGRGEASSKRPDLGWASAEVAYDHVRSMRYIPRLMSALGVRRWVWVLEFQRDGWPHWHVLWDRGEVGGGRLNYELLHHLWRDMWRVGLGKDSGPQEFEGGAKGAMLYITEYLVKHPDHGYPPWVWERRVEGHRGSIRFIQASRALGPLFKRAGLSDLQAREAEVGGSCEDWDGEEDDGQVLSESAERYADIVARCGTSTRFLVELVDGQGEVHRDFLGTLPCSPGELVVYGDLVRAVREVVGQGEASDAWVQTITTDHAWGSRRWAQVEVPLSWLPNWRAIRDRVGVLMAGRQGMEVPLVPLAEGESVAGFARVSADNLIGEAREQLAEYLAQVRTPATIHPLRASSSTRKPVLSEVAAVGLASGGSG